MRDLRSLIRIEDSQEYLRGKVKEQTYEAIFSLNAPMPIVQIYSNPFFREGS
jgi:hypothetical protein